MEVINLNLIPNGTNPVVHVSQYDEGRDFRFNLFDGTSVLTLDGTETIECDVKKPDGNIVTVAVTNTSSNYIVVTTTLQMTACSGNSLGTIKISKGGDNLYTLNFVLFCERSPLENGIQSDSAIHNLESQVEDIVSEQYDSANVIFDNVPTSGHGIPYVVSSDGLLAYIPKNVSDLSDVTTTTPTSGEALVWDGTKWTNGTPTLDVDDLNDVTITTPTDGEILVYNDGVWENQANPASTQNFAPDYDDTQTYNTNDKVIYQGLLYICNDDNVTGTWDATKWDAFTVADISGDSIPMSPNDPDKVADRITVLETSVSGKADSSDVYTQAQVNTLLGDKLDSSYLVKTNNGSFSALVKANQVWLIIVQRVSLNTSCVLICHNYNNSVITKEVILDSGMSYVTNSQGTVSITYGSSGESVRGGAYRLY